MKRDTKQNTETARSFMVMNRGEHILFTSVTGGFFLLKPGDRFDWQ